MAFSKDMRGAAHRHLEAAQKLHKEEPRATAAYLYGLAAECAVKELAESVPELLMGEIRLHFPELRTYVLENLTGRRGATLKSLLESDAFMNTWDIVIRYAPANEILRKKGKLDLWAKQASDAVNRMSAEA